MFRNASPIAERLIPPDELLPGEVAPKPFSTSDEMCDEERELQKLRERGVMHEWGCCIHACRAA